MIAFLTSCHTEIDTCKTGARLPAVVGLVLLAVVLCVGKGTAWGQAQNTGSIYGTVTDPSGAVVPKATVTAAEAARGITRTVTTSKTGEYVLPSLPVGTYTLTVSAEGFQTYIADSITLDATKEVKITPQLTIGNKGETVQVDAEGTALDTRSATLGTLIDNKLVEELPIDGRNVVALAGLLPGVTDLNAPATNTSDQGGPTFSVSGSRNTQNLMLFDGLMWNNLFFNTGINYPPPNGLQEISVLTNNFKAQYGRNAGSVFNVLTKSGTNKIHGAVWDYFQNKVFNAADYLTQVNPKDNSNQLGFTVGGPIMHDKLYYSVTFQDLIQRLQATGTAPYAQGYAERGLNSDGTTLRPCVTPVYGAVGCASYALDITQGVDSTGKVAYSKLYVPGGGYISKLGDASTVNDMLQSAWLQAGHSGQNPCVALLAAGSAYAATHPYLDGTMSSTTALYLPNAEIPVPCLNPVLFGQPGSGQNLLAPGTPLTVAGVINHYVPLPNQIRFRNGILQPQSTTSSPQPRDDKNALIRIDWVASTHHNVDARYNLIDSNDATAPGVNSASQGVPTFEVSANNAVSNFGNIGDTWQLGGNLLNVFRVGYKRYSFLSPPSDHLTWNDFGGNFVEPGVPVMPVINVSGAYKLGTAGGNGSSGQANGSVINENIEILEQLSWTKGNHSFQFGANFLRLQYLNNADYPGTLSFSTNFTGSGTGDEAFGLLGSVQANSHLVQGGVEHSVFMYAQDDWRTTSKLTLNLGIRYELPFQWYQPNGYASTFLPGHQSTVFPNAIGGLAYPGDAGVLPSLVPTDFNGFAPRVGIAYDVFGNGKLALRGGFGLFFDAINADVIGVGEPFYFQYYNQVPPGGASVPLQVNSPPDRTVRTLPNGYDKANPQFAPPYSLFYPDRNFRTPYYESTNIGFETRVDRGGVLDVNYVGKFGRKLTIPFDQNPAIYDCSGGYFQANPAVYCTGATSDVVSTRERLRYTPFNYGGGGLVDFASIGTSNYNGLQLQFTQRGGKWLTVLGSYTYSKSIDLQTNSQSTTNAIPNVFNVSSERGVSDYDARHIFNMGWVVQLPSTTMSSGFAKAILNNWQYGGVFITHSGRPYSILINDDAALDGEPNQRASIVPGMSPYLPKNRHRVDKVNEYFNTAAFTYPQPGTFSPQKRNSFVGPGYIQTDMNLGRSFPLSGIHEGMRLLFRAEAFNVFNIPNLANPSNTFSCTTSTLNGGLCAPPPANPYASSTTALSPTSTFGEVLSTFGNNANTSTNGRKMQFSATVYF